MQPCSTSLLSPLSLTEGFVNYLCVRLTQDSDAHLQAEASSNVGCSAGVYACVSWLGENDMQRSRAEDTLMYRLGQWLPVFVPANGRDRVSFGLALQSHRAVHRHGVGLDL